LGAPWKQEIFLSYILQVNKCLLILLDKDSDHPFLLIFSTSRLFLSPSPGQGFLKSYLYSNSLYLSFLFPVFFFLSFFESLISNWHTQKSYSCLSLSWNTRLPSSSIQYYNSARTYVKRLGSTRNNYTTQVTQNLITITSLVYSVIHLLDCSTV